MSARATSAAAVCAIAISAAAIAGCGSSAPAGNGVGSSGGSGAKGGSVVNVAVAYPSPPASELARFTKQTGITVHWTNVGYDELQTKIAASAVAHAYFADVTDVDWSKVGEYYKLGWFYPLNQYFSVSGLSSQVAQLSSFVDNGKLVGMPMDSSFMTTTINRKAFQKARISAMPTTISQYTADLQRLRSSGVVQHPLNIPLQAQEGLSTYWYETTAAFGGTVLTPNGKPAFTSPSSAGYKALQWIVNAYKSGLTPPGNLNIADVASYETNMAHGLTASSLSESSGTVSTIYDSPSNSSVVGQVGYIPTPSISGAGPNLGNPDGIGIPKTARNVKGAAEFIKWFDSTPQQVLWASGKIVSFPLPVTYAAMDALVRQQKGAAGSAQLGVLLRHTKPVFPSGPPARYAQFSNAVSSNIHAAAAGQESVGSAVSAIAQTLQ